MVHDLSLCANSFDLFAAMPTSLLAAWQHYQQTAEGMLRRDTLQALDVFVTQWSMASQQERDNQLPGLALRLARSEQRIHGPLLERVVVPELLAMRAAGSVEAIWLLARLQHEYAGRRWCREFEIPPYTALLEEALVLDPTYEPARTMFVQRSLSGMEYVLHELPAGVLFDHDGASADDCLVLLQELDQVIALMSPDERVENADFLRYARFHFDAYRRYLLHTEHRGYFTWVTEVEKHPPDVFIDRRPVYRPR